MSERMQSLLSRAVEDQLSEQRQLAGALTEVRAQLSHLGSQLEGMQGGAAGPQVEQAMAGVTAEVREAVRLLAERLDGVAQLVQQRGHDLAEQRAAIEEVKGAVAEHSRALGGITGGLSALPAFGDRIDTLQGGLGGLTDRLRGLEELGAAVTALQQRAESVDNGLRELRQAFTGVASRAAQLPGREDLDAAAGRVTDAVEGLSSRLGRIESSLPSLLERLDALAAAQAEHADALAALHDRFDDVAAANIASGPLAGDDAAAESVLAIEASLRSVREKVDELHRDQPTGDELGELRERLDALHEGVLGEGGLTERVQQLAVPGQGVAAEEVRALVADAVAETEQRLSDHIDEAVLALAEALLRRRPARSGSRPDLQATAPPVEGAAAHSALADDTVAGDDDGADDLDEDPDGDLDEDADEDLDEDADDDEDGGVVRAGVNAPSWQTPIAAASASEAPAPPETVAPDEGTPQKRKPWWRPGG